MATSNVSPIKNQRMRAEDLDWEEPPSRGGGRGKAEFTQLVNEVMAMVPALRERVGYWAVVDTFPKPATASAKANALRKRFERRVTVEHRLEFRGSKVGTGSKLYVRLPKE